MRFSTWKRQANAENKEDNVNDNYKSAYEMLIMDEETSAEFINPAKYKRSQIKKEGIETRTRNSFGIFALLFSIASLFFLPVILGFIGIIVGIFATKADSKKTMGIAAIIIGVFSVFAGLMVYPFF